MVLLLFPALMAPRNPIILFHYLSVKLITDEIKKNGL